MGRRRRRKVKDIKIVSLNGPFPQYMFVRGRPPVNLPIYGPYREYVSQSGLHWVDIYYIEKAGGARIDRDSRIAFRGAEVARIMVTDVFELLKPVPKEGKNITPLGSEYTAWQESIVRELVRPYPAGLYVAIADVTYVRLFAVWELDDIVVTVKDSDPIVRQSNLEIWRVDTLQYRDKNGNLHTVEELVPFTNEEMFLYEYYGATPLVMGGHALWFPTGISVAKNIRGWPEIALLRTSLGTKVIIKHHEHEDVEAKLQPGYYIAFHRPHPPDSPRYD